MQGRQFGYRRIDNDHADPCRRGLCHRAWCERLRPQIHATEFGHHLADMGAGEQQLGMTILARQQVVGLVAELPVGFFLRDPHPGITQAAQQEVFSP